MEKQKVWGDKNVGRQECGATKMWGDKNVGRQECGVNEGQLKYGFWNSIDALIPTIHFAVIPTIHFYTSYIQLKSKLENKLLEKK